MSRDRSAPIAGEMSGHIFFGERWYGFDDAIYCAARLLEILSRSKRPERGAERAAHQLQHARAQRAVRRGRASPAGGRAPGSRRRRPPEIRRRRGQHHRRPARRLARRLRPDPRQQHHAGAGAALRGPHARGLASHRGRHDGRAQVREARRQGGRSLTLDRDMTAPRRPR